MKPWERLRAALDEHPDLATNKIALTFYRSLDPDETEEMCCFFIANAIQPLRRRLDRDREASMRREVAARADATDMSVAALHDLASPHSSATWEEFELAYAAADPEVRRRYDCEVRERGQVNAALRARRDRLTDEVRRVLDKLVPGTQRVEWTAELLAHEFAVARGRSATIGAATLNEHEQRIAMQQSQTAGALRDISLHLEAVAILASTGAACLNDLVDDTALEHLLHPTHAVAGLLAD